MPSANGQFQVLLPRPLKAKAVAAVKSRKTRWRSQGRVTLSEGQQLGITETKKSGNAKPSEKRSGQMHMVTAKVVRNDGEVMVMFP